MDGPQLIAVTSIFEVTKVNIMNGTLIVVPMNPAVFACVLCIIFMWFESVVGYCVGCSIYAWLMRKGWIKGYKNQNCIDGKCEI